MNDKLAPLLNIIITIFDGNVREIPIPWKTQTQIFKSSSRRECDTHDNKRKQRITHLICRTKQKINKFSDSTITIVIHIIIMNIVVQLTLYEVVGLRLWSLYSVFSIIVYNTNSIIIIVLDIIIIYIFVWINIYMKKYCQLYYWMRMITLLHIHYSIETIHVSTIALIVHVI